jgi:hypothetical protein
LPDSVSYEYPHPIDMLRVDIILAKSTHIKIDMYFSYGFTCMQIDEMKSNLSQIGYDVESIHEMISGLVSCNASYSLKFIFDWRMPLLIPDISRISTGREA